MSRQNRERRERRRQARAAANMGHKAPQQLSAPKVVARYLRSTDPIPAGLTAELQLRRFAEYSVLTGQSISRYAPFAGHQSRLRTMHGEVEYDDRPVWEHLGGAVIVTYQDIDYGVRIPGPRRVLELLEATRVAQFDLIRGFAGGTDRMFELFQTNYRQQPWFREFFDQGSLGSLYILNLMAVYVAVTYHCIPVPADGWVTGRHMENQSLLSTLPPLDTWPAGCRDMVRRYSVNVVDVGGFALPDGGHPEGTAGGGQRKRGSQQRYDPERLHFAMSLPGFRELRGLQFRNPNRYVAAVFEPNRATGAVRVTLDSPFTKNRLFCLEGILEHCLAVAQLRKGEIRSHPACVTHFPHDPKGNWKALFRQWLGC